MARYIKNGNIQSGKALNGNFHLREKEETTISVDERSIDHPSSVCLEEREESVVIVKKEKIEAQRKSNFRRQGPPLYLQESEDNGSRWSLRTLRKKFEEAKVEDLYQRYWLQMQRVLLFKLLLVVTTYGVIVLILYNVLRKNPKKEDSFNVDRLRYIWVNVILGIALAISTMCMVLVHIQHIFMKLSRVIAVLVWLFLLALLYAFAPLSTQEFQYVSPVDNVPMTFFSIFVIHTMLPTARRFAFVLGILTGLIDIAVVAILYQSEDTEWKLRPIFANLIIYLCANLTGLYHKYLTDLAHRHTFWDSRKFIEADIKYSRQRERQIKMKEALLMKVIPQHLLDDMKKVLNKKIAEVDEGPQKIFYDLYVDRHDDVSILYADIVNFTPLTEKMGSDDLVEVLNQLFGRFDNLAKENQCMRIKMLGDCYYCVSGLPDPVEDHARNCVIMGLQMMYIIRDFRAETGIDDLDMRIGINTGYVLSGVLGLRKWQYDVWSDDVTVANHMESAGKAGKVHITAETLQKLNGEFKVDPANGKSRSEYLKDNDIETYFISDTELNGVHVMDVMRRINNSQLPGRRGAICYSKHNKKTTRRVSIADSVGHWGAEKPFNSLSDYMLVKTFPEMNEINQRLERGFLRVNSQGAKVEGQGFLRTPGDIHPITLRFRDTKLEKEYESLRDSSFKFYTFCAFTIFLFMFGVQILILAKNPALYATMLAISFGFVILIIFTTGLKCLPCYNDFPINCIQWLRDVTEILITNKWCKVALSFISCGLIFLASILPPVIDCQIVGDGANGSKTDIEILNSTFPPMYTDMVTSVEGAGEKLGNAVWNGITCDSDKRCCLFAPYYLFSCMLALISCSVFLRIPYVIKSIYMIIGLVVFNTMFYLVFHEIFEIYDYFMKIEFLQTNLKGTLYTAVLCATLIVLDRQLGTNLRLAFLCKVRIQKEKEEVRRNELLNELLLNNILPRHVAEHFTKASRSKNELYHERCTDVCVMFAAIPNFNMKTFFSNVDVTGKECLRLLNEIISTFDKMLVMRQFDGVEKIKIIGSTYMAAAGLHDRRTENTEARAADNVVLMVRFAYAMIQQLAPISKDAFGNYQLRIGINHGDLVAGVVGAQKPQYDIWGDVVNVSSRMESQGVCGRIQVPEATANLLTKKGYPCEYRGLYPVKGKGMMSLYLVGESKFMFDRMISTVSTDTTDVYLG